MIGVFYGEIAAELRKYYLHRGRRANALFCNARRRMQLAAEMKGVFGNDVIAAGPHVAINFGYGPVDLHTNDALGDGEFQIGEIEVVGLSLESYAGL